MRPPSLPVLRMSSISTSLHKSPILETHKRRELLHEIENLRHMWLERVESGSDSSEKEWLQDERERLEVRQDILETHNRQLEYQLQRLRHLIGQVCLVVLCFCFSGGPLTSCSASE